MTLVNNKKKRIEKIVKILKVESAKAESPERDSAG